MSEEIDYEMRYFKAASVLIKSLCVILGTVLLFFSQFAFIFYCIAMAPSVIAAFIDRQYQSHLSSTICTFNLIGVLPYLSKFWNSPQIDVAARNISTDISSWVVIFGSALLGQILFWFLPPIIAKLYILKCRVEASLLKSTKDKLCSEWNIKTDALKSNNSNKK